MSASAVEPFYFSGRADRADRREGERRRLTTPTAVERRRVDRRVRPSLATV